MLWASYLCPSLAREVKPRKQPFEQLSDREKAKDKHLATTAAAADDDELQADNEEDLVNPMYRDKDWEWTPARRRTHKRSWIAGGPGPNKKAKGVDVKAGMRKWNQRRMKGRKSMSESAL